jgi:hypothetical protein
VLASCVDDVCSAYHAVYVVARAGGGDASLSSFRDWVSKWDQRYRGLRSLSSLSALSATSRTAALVTPHRASVGGDRAAEAVAATETVTIFI